MGIDMRGWAGLAAAAWGLLGAAAQAQAPAPAPAQAPAAATERTTCARAADGGPAGIARLEACNHVIAANPAGNELRDMLGYRADAERVLRRFDDAVRDASRAIELGPTLYAHSVRALSLSALGRHADAARDYDRAVELAPGQPTPLLNRAYARLNQQQREEAVRDFDAVLERAPDNLVALSGRTQALRQLGRGPDAIAGYTRALAANPGAEPVLRERGNAYLQLGSPTEALADFTRASELAPDDALAWLGRGRALVALNRASEALDPLDHALRLRPDDLALGVERGNLSIRLRQYPAALAEFERVLGRDGRYIPALYARGVALRALDRMPEALAAFEAILAIDPQQLGAQIQRTLTLVELDRFDEAIAAANQLVQRSSTATEYVRRGTIYVRAGRADEAVADFAWAANLAPHDTLGSEQRCAALAMLGRNEDAQRACDEGLAGAPGNVPLLTRRAYVRLRLRAFDGAIADFDAVLAASPDNAFALFGRGLARERKGDQVAGEADIAAARHIDTRQERQSAWLWLDYDPSSGTPAPRRPTLAQ
jgi:tetratricopeptide (TPR) repeat protein